METRGRHKIIIAELSKIVWSGLISPGLHGDAQDERGHRTEPSAEGAELLREKRLSRGVIPKCSFTFGPSLAFLGAILCDPLCTAFLFIYLYFYFLIKV